MSLNKNMNTLIGLVDYEFRPEDPVAIIAMEVARPRGAVDRFCNNTTHSG